MINDLKIQRTILEMPSVFTLPELYNKLGISEHGEASERTHVLEILDELMNTLLVEFADLDDESVVAYRSVLAAEYEEETTRNVGKDYDVCDQFVCEGMSKTTTNEEIVERRKGMNDRDYTIFAQQVMSGKTIKSW